MTDCPDCARAEQALNAREFTRCTSCAERQANNADVEASLCPGCRANKTAIERLHKESDDLSRYHFDEFVRYKQARNEQHERYDVLHAQFTAAQATLAAECVEHAELTGHIDIAEQCRDWLAMREEDSGGKVEDFVESLGIVIRQLDRQRRRANWYEAAHEAGKEKLIESRLAKALEKARDAARKLATAVTALGLAAPDSPEVLATDDPIADAEFALWSALGIDGEHPAMTERARVLDEKEKA